MPPKRKQKPFGDPDEVDGDIDYGNAEPQQRIEVTAELLEELKHVDISNYPIPEKYGAAYKNDGKQRLMIGKMILENFKSYCGKQSVGPFHPHFSAIVGANGSGKSNIIDALMFVFGSRVTKIRSTNVKALIHKSSAMQNLTSCSVTIHFQLCQDEADGKHSIVPESQFTVKRIITHSGQSKYYYNDDNVGRNELRNKLQEHGIDMDHNRFLILQGEVEMISTMKPKAEKENDQGLLEYLDDIIGTSRLRDKVKDLDMKVNVVDNERQRQLMKVQESGKFKNELVGPVREMVKILMIENKMAHCKHKMLSFQLHTKDQSLAESRRRQEELDASLVEQEERLKQIIEGNTEAKVIVKEKSKELEAAHHSQRKQREQLDKEQMRLKRTCLNHEKATKLLDDKKKEMAKTEENIKKLEKRPEKNAAEAEELKAEMEEVKAKIEEVRPELQEKNKEANVRTTELEKERNEIGMGLSKAKAEEDEANSKLTLAQSKQMQMKEPLEKAQNRFNENKRNLEKTQDDYQAEERRIQEIIEGLPSLEARYNKANEQLESTKQREKQLSSKFETFRNQYSHAKSEQQSTQKSNWAVQKFMEEKRSGRIPGIYGRLGDLGNIDPKYDVAISTTCGARMDNIVTDTYETAKQCLEFMSKESNFPRKTMIAIDKIGRFKDHMRPIKTPMDLPRLFDLVRPTNPDVAIAFYFALQDTLVCDDIRTARNASMMFGKKWRVVTLDGNAVETSGAMTGGGTNVVRGKIGTNVNVAATSISEEELDALKRKVEESERQLNEIRNQLSHLEVERTEASTTFQREKSILSKLQAAHKQHETDLKYFQSNDQLLRSDLEKAQADVSDEKIAAIRNEIRELTEDRDKLEKESSIIQTEYDRVSKQITSVYNEIAGDAQATFDQHQTRQKEIEKKLADLRKSSSKAQIDLNKAVDNIESIQEAIENAEKNIEKLENEKMESEEVIQRLEVLLTEKEDHVKAIEAEIKSESEKAEQNNEEEVNLKKIIREAKIEQEGLMDKIRKSEAKMEEFVLQRDALKLNDINDLLNDESVQKPATKKRIRFALDEEDDEEDDDGRDLSDEDNSEEEDQDESTAMEIDDDAESTEGGPVDESRLATFINYAPEQIATFDVDHLKHVYEELQGDRRSIKTNLNLNQLDEYRKRLATFKQEEAHLVNLTKALNAVQNVYDRFINQRLEEFTDALSKINEYLRSQYYALSLGGEAYLQAISPMDAYAEGIKFLVRPKSKSWREIGMTSGGEKTISSLSLVFALHQFLPTPFYVMDEIDAALDFRNVAMISKFVKEKTKNSQFIIISLRDNMYQLANRLIGVFKVQDKAYTCLMNHSVKKQTTRKRKSHEPVIMPA